MDFRFTDDQLLFQATVRDVLAKECPPEHVRACWTSETGRSPALWATLAELGVIGLTVPEEHGGLGMTEEDLVLLLEETGRAALPEPVLETTAVAAPLLAELGGPLADEWLPRIAAGEAIVATGLHGSPVVGDVHVADLVLLERDGELHAVAPAAITPTRQPSMDGARRLFSVEWQPIDATCVVTGPEARALLDTAFDRGALGAAAQLVGLARHQLAATVDYVAQREQFGKPVGSQQAVKHRLADAALALDFAAPMVYRAAWSMSTGGPERTRDVSMAKQYASDAANTVSRASLQCHGAIGYTVEYDLHLWMKRTWALQRAWGDATFHRRRVSDWLLA